MKTDLILLLAIAVGFAAVCTASPCPTTQYTSIHAIHHMGNPALGSLDGAMAAKVPSGQASYVLSVKRSDVNTVCSMGHAGEEFKTYVPLKFDTGEVRLIKPVTRNSGCQSSAKGSSTKLQLLFKLLDSAEVGIVTCKASKSICHVHLYQSTVTDGYHKEPIHNSTSISKPSHGRKLR